jgi:hypothetical protein
VKIIRTILTILTAVLLSACNLQIKNTIRPDGSNDLRTEIGFTTEDKQMLSTFGSTTEDLCSSVQSESGLSADTTFSKEERGDETWCTMQMSFASLDELHKALEEGSGITVNRLEIVDGKLYYDLEVDMSTDEANLGQTFPMTLKWQVNVPGKVINHNANQVDGKTLTWNLAPNQNAQIQVESSLSGGKFPKFPAWPMVIFLLLCMCCFGIIVVIVIVLFVIMRRRKTEPTGEIPAADLPAVEPPVTEIVAGEPASKNPKPGSEIPSP